MEHDASLSTRPEPDGALLARRNDIMAAALRRLHTELQATTSTIYLAARDGPGVPLFISAAPPQATQVASTHLQASDAAGPTIAGSTFLFQLVQLASELTAAVRPGEILSACWEHMVRPFGGSAVMLCLA